jgi:hypothetical protein
MVYKSTDDMDSLIDHYLKGEMSPEEQDEFIDLLYKDKRLLERAYMTAMLIVSVND